MRSGWKLLQKLLTTTALMWVVLRRDYDRVVKECLNGGV